LWSDTRVIALFDAAHKLGAANVTVVDIDPQALQVTRESARGNGCDIEVSHPDSLGKWSADLVIANILPNPLIELATDLSRCFEFVAPVYRDMSLALILMGDWCGPVSELTLI
jgi:ribosomal protein L11 methylase PrmA